MTHNSVLIYIYKTMISQRVKIVYREKTPQLLSNVFHKKERINKHYLSKLVGAR